LLRERQDFYPRIKSGPIADFINLPQILVNDGWIRFLVLVKAITFQQSSVLTDVDETAVICLKELDESGHKSCKILIWTAK